MNNKIIDGMRKEGKPFRNIMLFGYIFAILMPLSIYLMNNDKISGKDIILFAIAGVMFGTIGLVGGGIAGAIETGTWDGVFEGAANGFMMGSITGAISGGIRGGINYARTTPLLKSVSSQELNSIRNSGKFSSPGKMEGKWFATTKSNVMKWGTAFKQNDYVGIRVLKSALKSDAVYYSSMLDYIGAAYCIENTYLNTIIHSIWFF